MVNADVTKPQPIAVRPQRYDGVSMMLHWLTLLLLIVLFGSMWLREQVSDGDRASLLLTVHRSTGALVWAITLGRLSWKQHFGRAPTLPSTMPKAQQWAAHGNAFMLYLFLIIQPVTGFVQSIARGKPFPLLGLVVPPVMPRSRHLTHLFHGIHEISATVLLVLIGLHTCAALYHGFVKRDGVLPAMLPVRPQIFRK